MTDLRTSSWSLEATLPKPAEIEAVASVIEEGTEVFLSTLPHVSLDQQIETARIVRSNGLEPVLHIATRYFATRTEMVGYLARANQEAEVSRVLVIGGDLHPPRGEFDSALAFIKSGLASDYGIKRIGVAGYPEGHPKIPDATLWTEMGEKLASARAQGLDFEIVTQFCFSPDAIVDWLDDTWERWPGTHVRLGFAGPASAKSILRYALRCGVKTPKSGLGHKLTAASRLAKNHDPAPSIVAVGDAIRQKSGSASVHLFSFGGVENTVRWMNRGLGSSRSADRDPQAYA